eukprot:TRINITY_DN161_c0_g2_i5.p1 TRINITY_DN161_c0_g2~~TRINITY_DN161_c0_g2_i5.p1  ORF type:complete len:282 (+),score=58.17 TRINITY_DN161_c0_g2_i5:196-1041(+)
MKPNSRTSKELSQKSERKFSKKISDKKVSNEDIKENDSKKDPIEPICQNIKIVKTKTGLYVAENVESSSTSSSESDVHEESSSSDSDICISMESRGKKTLKVTGDNFSKASSSTTESDSISTSTPDTSATSSSSYTSESTTASTSASSSVSDSEVVPKKIKTVVGKKKDELYDTSKSVSSLVRKSGASSTVSSTESEDSDDSPSESSSDEDIPILQLNTIIRGRKRKARKPVSRRTKRQRRRIVRVKSGKDCRVEKITGEQGGKDGQVKALEIAGDGDKNR